MEPVLDLRMVGYKPSSPENQATLIAYKEPPEILFFKRSLALDT